MSGMGGNFFFLMFMRLLLESPRGAGGAVSNPKEGGNPRILPSSGLGRDVWLMTHLELPLFSGNIFFPWHFQQGKHGFVSWVSYINGPEVIPSPLPPYLSKIGHRRVGIETQMWNICPGKALPSIKPTLGICYWEPGWVFLDMWDHVTETWRQKMLKKQRDVKKATKSSIKWQAKKKRWVRECQSVQGIFFSALNIGFKQEE